MAWLGLAWWMACTEAWPSGAPPCVAILRFTAAGLDAPRGSAFLLLPGIFTNTKVAFVVAKSWGFQFAVPTMVDGLPRWRSAAHTRLHKFQICTRDVPIYVGSHSALAVALTQTSNHLPRTVYCNPTRTNIWCGFNKHRLSIQIDTMAVLHQYDYIFAVGMLFAFLDAWNIGANDVANSFVTSVSSRSLAMK